MGSRAPPLSSACRLTARHGGADSAEGTQGAPWKIRRQGAATASATHRVSVGCAPSLRLPRQSHTAPLNRLPPAPLYNVLTAPKSKKEMIRLSLALLGMLATTSLALPISSAEHEATWTAWKREHNKAYGADEVRPRESTPARFLATHTSGVGLQ
jgi:hypothetical protein